MGIMRKTVSVGLTGGLVGYHSPQEKAAKQAKKNGKAQRGALEAQQQAAQAQAAAAQQQAAYMAQQQRIAQQQHQAQMAAMQQQQAESSALAYQQWLANQPVTCGHCQTVSAAGTNFCPNCGSKDVAYRAPEQQAPAAAPPAKGLKGLAARMDSKLGKIS